jgi:putative nucleotidyltransferase with HDIG domain
MALKTPILSNKAIRWLAIFLIAACYLFGFFERPELITIDLRYQLSSSLPHPQITLVMIDQASLKELAQWPWPRHYYAEVIKTLKTGGAKLIALDLDFSTPSDPWEDQKLVEAVLSAGNVVLSAFHEDKVLQDNIRVRSANFPFPRLYSAASGIGSILFPVDEDGAMRRAYVEDEIHGEPALSLTMELTRQFLNLSREEMKWEGAHQFRLGKQKIHTRTDRTFYINYVGRAQSFPTYSFADILQKRIKPEVFIDKIVLIGASAMELKDIWKSPFAGLTPGVEIQANTLHTLLSGKTITRIPPWGTLLLILLSAIVLDLPMTRSVYQRGTHIMTRFVLFTALTLALAVGFSLVSLYLFKYRHLLLDTTPVLTSFLVQYLLTSFAFNLLTSQTGQIRAMSLSTVHSVGKLSLKDQPLQASLNMVFSMLKDPLQIKIMMLDLHHPKTKQCLQHITLGIDSIQDARGQTPECQGWIKRVLDSNESVIVPDLKRVLQDSPSPHSVIKSSLFVPLLTHHQRHGVLHIHSPKPHAFEEEDAMMLYTIANQLAMNIENLDLLKEVQRLFYSCIEGFSTALEFKDNETEGHCQRVAGYAVEVSQRMGIDSRMQEMMRQGAMLHDIGKIGVPDAILKKPGQLTPEEMKVMRKHPEYGYRMLKNVNFSEEVTLILLQHHERYDGSGYPAGLKGEDIFIGARVFTLVDAYDAMRSDRPYRKGTAYESACAEILRCSGSQFDPGVVEVFLKIPKETMEKIREEVDLTIKTKGLQAILAQGKNAQA